MTIMVAGAKGLAGSAIADFFESIGHRVIRAGREQVDYLDLKATIDFVQQIRPSLIVDAAAKVGGIAANQTFPVEFLVENLTIQNNLMRAAFESDVEKFIFLGSSCIYPRDCPQPIKEEYILSGPLEETNSAYAIAKIAGIRLIEAYRNEYGRKWISLMPSNLYGPKDNFDLLASHVLPAFIRKFIEAKEFDSRSVTLWGTGSPLREFLYVEDLARAVYHASEFYDSPGHVNVGTGEEVSIKDLALLVASLVGFQGEILWDSSKPDGTPRKVLDVSKMNSLGWAPKVDLSAGITRTISWYREELNNGGVRK